MPDADNGVMPENRDGCNPEHDWPWAHIRSQFTYHAEATLVANDKALHEIGFAISEALAYGKAECELTAADGEGYSLIVRRTRTVSGLGRPTYLDEEARAIADNERTYLVRESKANRAAHKEAADALRWCRANGNPHKAKPMP